MLPTWAPVQENVRRFAPKRVLVDTNQAAGWAGGLGGALRVSQYTMAGRVGGTPKRTSIEFGVVSAGCRVQSAGSLLGGGVPKLTMSDSSGTCFAMWEEQLGR